VVILLTFRQQRLEDPGVNSVGWHGPWAPVWGGGPLMGFFEHGNEPSACIKCVFLTSINSSSFSSKAFLCIHSLFVCCLIGL
jgi:hypothetical protein